MRIGTPNRRGLFWALFTGAWAALGLLSSVEVYIAQMIWDKPVAWGIVFTRTFKETASYAALSLGVLWLCRKLPLTPGKATGWFLKHLTASILFALAHVSAVSYLMTGETSVQTGEVLTFGELFRKLSVNYTLSNIFKYWLFVLGCLGWHYYKGFRERETQAARLREQLTDARLHALRMQLNPHFLFNTLNAISAMISENPGAADRMVVKLSELLRLSLDQEKPQESPLSEELAFLDRYLEIEKVRFGDRLQVEIRIQDETKDAAVPSLILQPIVENAIRHGIEPSETAGRLWIEAACENGSLCLRVRDSGPGLAAGVDNLREGIGLSNTRSRLRHLYGENGTLELSTPAGGGLEARIRIPFRLLKGFQS
jgi:hypothetical protein